MNATLTERMTEWEEAWAEYVNALEAYDTVTEWGCGDDWVLTVGRCARNLEDAKRRLRGLDAEFCKRLEIQ